MSHRPAGSRLHFRAFDVAHGWGMTWRLQTKVDENDIYLETIEGKRWAHSSLHSSGQIHDTLTYKALKKAPAGTERWDQVYPAAPEAAPGVEHFAHIIVEADSLSIDWHESGTPDDVIDVGLDPRSPGVAFDIYRVLGDEEPAFGPTARAVGSAFLGGGGRAAVVAHPLQTDGPLADLLASDLPAIRQQAEEAGMHRPFRLAYRMVNLDQPALRTYADVLIR